DAASGRRREHRMNDEEFCKDWRQVRVFFGDFSPAGFRSFHWSVTLPLVQAGLSVPLFVSHYACSDAQDSGDTDIQALPSVFRRPDKNHHSIRIRFRDADGAEQQLNQAIAGVTSWHSGFRTYEPIGDL